VLDVGGLGRLLGDAHGIAAELQRTAIDRGLGITIALAPTQTAARLLALGSESLCEGRHRASPASQVASVVTGDLASALAPVPLDTLQQLVGEPSRTFDALRRWGVRTVGEFAALPADELAARFGREGLAIQSLARGLDLRPLVPDPGVPRFIQSIELEWPIEELEPLSFVLARLLDPLSLALEHADKGGAAIRLDLRLTDKTIHSRMMQLPAPIRDARVLRTLLSLDLESHPPSAAIDIVTIEIDPAPARIVQFSLLARAMPSPETLATLTARLNALVGADRCGSPVLVDSHRPDAFEMTRFSPAEHRRNPGNPEPRPAGTLCLRRFRPPIAVRVGTEQGRPVHVAIDRRGMPGGRVGQSAGPWRCSGAWWDAGGSHWDRDEWDVALSDSSICRLYRDRSTGRWFLDGVVD
jgi:protein ImuB